MSRDDQTAQIRLAIGAVYPDTPLHQVLMNDELIHLILTELFSLGSRGDLLQAALTSKAFLSPALEILWRTLDSPIPLLSLLPPLDNGRSSMVTHFHTYKLSKLSSWFDFF